MEERTLQLSPRTPPTRRPHKLLSSISTLSSSSLAWGFFNDSAPVPGSSETLYLIGSCRGDLTAESCRNCLSGSAIDVTRSCPDTKEAIFYGENCTVRYSNTSIFATVAIEPNYILTKVRNVSSQVTFMLDTQMEGLWREAAGGGPLRKFATRNMSVGLDTIYAMAQCTPDLTEEQCIECQETIFSDIKRCCLGNAATRTTVPSCQFHYEVNYRFFDPVAEPLPPPPLPPPPPPRPPPGTSALAQALGTWLSVFLLF
ncbi:cysteine-rich receptor-like protein kinase 25 [Eucalyptus grandis]|uniref:cysteine-rich receptor-like protein kinase 25 n=1 Tax=Eucalyptus grandis TaxID=71139 RepID=UPI00192E763B|nr:cysteine-rich receptor-like protein kinase 25 [Eucalyptus grandis]